MIASCNCECSGKRMLKMYLIADNQLNRAHSSGYCFGFSPNSLFIVFYRSKKTIPIFSDKGKKFSVTSIKKAAAFGGVRRNSEVFFPP
jgi:hypothetical protein